ncbi:hypothetical protein [Marinobacter nauticus]|uniref:hypothetical protein n=1 Tax=Marinobacter nauticus TaxID=2743 RepID=UPI000EAE019E|nr:hypothetical protein [Marinobacter nauticus]RKR79180.1 hypothetical protein C7436_0618 [Marinobacter nauticus]
MLTSDSPANILASRNLAMALSQGGGAVSGFAAQPGFTLTDNGDGTFTINDAQSRFGIKPNAAKPVWFFDFGSGSDQPHPALSRNQKALVWNASSGPSTEIKRPNATHAMVMDAGIGGKGTDPLFAGDGDKTLTLPPNAGRKYFRYLDTYNDFTIADLNARIEAITSDPTFYAPNLKANRWQSESAQSVAGAPYTPNYYQANSYRFQFLGDAAGEYDSEMYKLSTAWAAKHWEVQEEYHEISSAAGATDASMYGVLDGVEKFSRLNQDSHNGLDPSDPAYRWNHYKVMNFEVWADPGYARWFTNVLYIDDSWCRVYITDKPAWNPGEQKAMEIQVPTAWIADDLTFFKRNGQFSSLSGKHLWVADNDDNKILIGSWD